MKNHEPISRRQFIKSSAVATAGALAYSNFAWAQGSDRMRVGLIGCGGRGSGAANDCCSSADGVELVAMADVFKDRLDGARKNLGGSLKEKFKVTDETAFSGLDAYQKLLATNVDMVLLTTPPGFRPVHFKAAVEAGKHVFMEKPVAVCPTGVRTVIEAAGQADKKKLSVVAGTQRRHEARYLETMKRIHDGAIGELVGGQCYWNGGGTGSPRKPESMDEMQKIHWQIRNWYFFTWLSGDHVVEQHIHNIDILNWAFKAHPEKAYALGGRQVRTNVTDGHIFDHFGAELEYPNGIRTVSMCRQQDGTDQNVSEHVVGTKGHADPGGWIEGAEKWKFSGKGVNPYVQEHTDLIASIRESKPINEGKRVAESTMSAIMVRMSAYTGKIVTWDFAMKSTLNLMPEKVDLDMELPIPAVATPGKTPLV